MSDEDGEVSPIDPTWPEEEASRFKGLAEDKYTSGNLKAAFKYAKRAYKLHPSLGGLPEMLTAFKILRASVAPLCSETENPVLDYYEILDVEQFSHINTIKKQYKKLAMALHPDKNPLAASGEAFKLVGEAARVLSDKIRRKEYDTRLRVALQARAAEESGLGAELAVETFWTACSTCRLLHQFERRYLGHNLMCPRCKKTFKAVEVEEDGNNGGNSFNSEKNEGIEAVQTRASARIRAKGEVLGIVEKCGLGVKRKSSSVGETIGRSRVRAESNVDEDDCLLKDMKPKRTKKVGTLGEVGGGDNEEKLVNMNGSVDCGSKDVGVVTGSRKRRVGGKVRENVEIVSGSSGVGIVESERDKRAKAREEGTMTLSQMHMLAKKKKLNDGKVGIKEMEVNVKKSKAKEKESGNGKEVEGGQDYMKGKKNEEKIESEEKGKEENGKENERENEIEGETDLEGEKEKGKEDTVQGEKKREEENEKEYEKGKKKRRETLKEAESNMNCEQEKENDESEKEKEQENEEGNAIVTEEEIEILKDAEKDTEHEKEKEIVSDKKLEEENKENGKVKEMETGSIREKRERRRVSKYGNLEALQRQTSKNHADVQIERQPKNHSNTETEKLGTKKKGDLEIMPVEDSDFHDFDMDRGERSFRKGQVWGLYDDNDGMPRHYALIDEIVSVNPFEVTLSWLEFHTNGKEEARSRQKRASHLSCGNFKISKKVSIEHVNLFSHPVDCERAGREVYRIYPRKGSIWALYSNCALDADGRNKKTKNKQLYDIVVCLSTYSDAHGLSIAHLEKVPGFRTVFKRRAIGANAVICVGKEDVKQFSHQIPAKKLSGVEASGLPKDCWELDPASLTSELFEFLPFQK